MRTRVGIALLLFLIPAGAGAHTPWPPRSASESIVRPRPVTDADASGETLAGWAESETAALHGNGAEKSRGRQYLWDMAGPWTLAGASLKAGIDHLATCQKRGIRHTEATAGGSPRWEDASPYKQQSRTALQP